MTIEQVYELYPNIKHSEVYEAMAEHTVKTVTFCNHCGWNKKDTGKACKNCGGLKFTTK